MISHVMEPVSPGTFCVITTELPVDQPLYAAVMPNGRALLPDSAGTPKVLKGRRVKVVDRKGDCVTIDLPKGPNGVIAFSDQANFAPDQALWLANRPRLDWSYPLAAEPGRSLRLLGRTCVNPGRYVTKDPAHPVSAGGFVKGITRVALRPVGGRKWMEIEAEKSTGYEIHAMLPRRLKSGAYEVSAHNGWGGVWGWSEPMRLEVVRNKAWPTRVFKVDDYLGDAPSGHPNFDIYGNYRGPVGTDENRAEVDCFKNFGAFGERTADAAIAAALEAARKNGGGIVEFSGRIYDVTQTLVIPPRVVLRGQGMNRTWIRTPFGEGPRGPYVVITGDADFAVEDLRIVTLYAVVAIAAPEWVPATFDEAADKPWHMFKPKLGRNVAVRRCFIHQRISDGWGRHISKNCSEEERKWIDRINNHYGLAPDCKGSKMFFSGIRLRVHQAEITGNTVYAAQNPINLMGCRSVRIAGNKLLSGAGGTSVQMCGWREWPADEKSSPIKDSYLREILIEDNHLASLSDRSRNGSFFYQSGYLGYMARNRIMDSSRGSDGEGIGNHLWMERWTQPKLRMTGPTTGEIVDPAGQVARQDLIEGVIEIVDGRGVGQLRMITARQGDRIEIEKPWQIIPDETSLLSFTAPAPFHKLVYVDNWIENTGPSIILWGSSNDVVVDGNTTVYGPGIGVWSCNIAKLFTNITGGAVFTQVLNNTLDVGMFQPDDAALLRHSSESLPQHGVIANMGYQPADGYDFLGLIVRGNCTRNNSGIILKKTIIAEDRDLHISREAGLVCEGNFAEDSQVGIALEKGLAIAVRNNRARNVKRPLVWFDFKARTVEG